MAGRVTWRKNDLIQQLGQGFYDQYVSAGILVEDLVLDDSVEGSCSQHEVTETRFFHKLLCEWYAAIALVKREDIRDVCERLDPFELQYLYRFACGLNKKEKSVITESLKKRRGTEIFIILCLFESKDNEDEFLGTVRDLCSRELRLSEELSRLGQRSMIQMLEVASSNNIPITFLSMLGTFVGVDNDGIVLRSGLRLQRLSSLEQIRISEYTYQRECRRLTEEDVLNLLSYIQHSKIIQKLSMNGFVLPASLSPTRLSFNLKSKGVKVYWTPNSRHEELSLNLQTGLWKVKYNSIYIASWRNQDNPEGANHLQNTLSTIASYTDVRVDEITLNGVFFTTDETETNWRLNLRHLASVEKITVALEEKDRQLTNQELAKVIDYATLFKKLKELRFQPNQVPIKIPNNFLCQLRSSPCNPKVICNLNGMPEFRLNFLTGKWEVSSIHQLRSQLKGMLRLESTDSMFCRWAKLHILKIASRHHIPVATLIVSDEVLSTDDDKLVFSTGDPLEASPVIETIQFHGLNLQSNVNLMSGLLRYAQYSERLQQLRFHDCIVPSSIPLSSIPFNLRARNLQVTWSCNIFQFDMDLQSGLWEVKTIKQLRSQLQRTQLESTDSILCRWAKLHILKIASRHHIPVPTLIVSDNILSADDDKLVFNTGDPLEASPVIEKIQFYRLNLQRNVNLMSGLLRYAQHSERFQQLAFHNCIVPSSIPLASIPVNLRARNLQVTWSCNIFEFDMDLQSGLWEVRDSMALEKMCSEPITITSSDNCLKQVALVQMMVVAARRSIHIDCLHLLDTFANVEDDKITLLSSPLRYTEKTRKSPRTIYVPQCRERRKLQEELLSSVTQVHSMQSLKELQIGEFLLNPFTRGKDDMMATISEPLRGIPRTSEISEIIPYDVGLPPLRSLKKLEISFSKEAEMSTNVIPTLSRFGQHCNALKEIRITDIILSGSLSSNFVPSIPIIWSLQGPFGGERLDYRLKGKMPQWEVEDTTTLKKLCESTLYLRGWDTKLIQTSTIQIMKVACSYDIPVSCLVLDESFANIEEDGIALTSGLSVPKLSSLKKIVLVSERNKTLLEKEVSEIIGCSQMFEELKEICFSDKVLPLTIDRDTVKRLARGVKVCWGYYGYKLEPEKCLWEIDDIEVLKELCSRTVLIDKDEDKEVHECQRQLLIKASSIQIPVKILAFNESFSKSTGDSIILTSGSSLPHLPTVEEIELWMEQGHKIEEDELIAILEYGAKCKQLRHIKFFRCILPHQIPEQSMSSTNLMNNILVSWLVYQLDLERGTWQDKEISTDLSQDQYQREVEMMQKRKGLSEF